MSAHATTHPLANLERSLRDAGLVLVPAAARAADPFPASMSDVLHALCMAPIARTAVARAAARWAVGADEACEPHPGFAIIPLPLQRNVSGGGGRYAAVTLLAEAFADDTVERLAHSAGIDARLARGLVSRQSQWDRRGLANLSRLVAALARSESDRLAGAEAGTRLSAAWEELHLLHSLSGEMTVGASPRAFAARTLAELRATLGCRWTALRVGPSAQPLLESTGHAAVHSAAHGIICDGIEPEEAARFLREMPVPARAAVVGSDLVLAPVRREAQEIGLLVACERTATAIGGDGAMSNWERTLVETAAGHLSVFLDNARLYRDLDAMFMGSLSALVSAIDAKDPYTRGHSQRVAMLSRQIGESAGLRGTDLKNVHIAGLVHDVGKIGMPEAILRKQDRLTDIEFAQVKQHPEIGWRILRDIPQFAPVLDGVRYHHERIDGRGYPHGLQGDGIPLFARIIAIADTFDAMSSTRTYRAAKPRATVLAEMQACAGTQLDPRLFAHFRTIDLRGYDALNQEHAVAMREAA